MTQERTAVMDLAQLIARLRAKGLRIHTSQYLAAHQMLLVFASQGRLFDQDPDALASHLAPIFSTSPEEQRTVCEETIAWRAKAASPTTSLEGRAGSTKRAHLVAAMFAIVVSLGVGVWIAAMYWDPPKHSDGPGTTPDSPPPAATNPPATIETSFKITEAGPAIVETLVSPVPTQAVVAWQIIAAGSLGAGIMLFCGLWLAHRARREWVLRRLDALKDASRITLEPAASTLTDLSATAVRKIAAGLRRGRTDAGRELNVVRTVEATARRGGFISPEFSPRVATPEYLVLIDRLSAEDHSAQLMRGWIEQLHGRNVPLECYEFETDPRVCRQYGSVRWHSLSSLIARHHRATLLLCAESEVCFDALTDQPHEWLRWLVALPNRVFMTMAPRYRWSVHERLLLEAGFIVLPATPAGLLSAADMDRDWRQPNLGVPRYARDYPALVALDATRWIERNPAPDPIVARLQRELISYLGPEGYLWLCACAIYPHITWQMTLALLDSLIPAHNELVRRRALEEQLPALARLPWFRFGYMPDWLRRVLIAQLPPDTETTLRRQLEQLMQALLAKAGARMSRDEENLPRRVLSIAFRPSALDIASAAPVGSALRDVVFMDFLAGMPADPLALRLSPISVHSAFAKRGWLRQACAGWRRTFVRRAGMARALVSALVTLLIATGLYIALRDRIEPTPVRNGDVTFLIAASPSADSGIGDIAVAKDRSLLLIASMNTNNVIVWDLARQVATSLLTTDSPALAVGISPSSDRLAAVSQQGTVSLWERSGQLLSGVSLDRVKGQAPTSAKLRFSDDGQKVAAVWNGSVAIYNGARFVMTGDIAATDAAFGPMRPEVEVATSKGLVRWDIESNRMIAGESGGDLVGPGISFSPDGKQLAFSKPASSASRFDIKVGQFNTTNGSVASYLFPSFTLSSTVRRPFQWSPDSRVLAYMPTDRSIRIVDAQSGASLYEAQVAIDAGRVVLGRFQTFAQSPNSVRFTRELLRVEFEPTKSGASDISAVRPAAPVLSLSNDEAGRGRTESPSVTPGSSAGETQDDRNANDLVGYWRFQSGSLSGDVVRDPSPALYIQRTEGTLAVTECDEYTACVKAKPNPNFLAISAEQPSRGMAVLPDGRLRVNTLKRGGNGEEFALAYYVRSEPTQSDPGASDPPAEAGMTCGPVVQTPNLHEAPFDARDPNCYAVGDGKYCFRKTRLVVSAQPGFVFGETARPNVQCVRDNEGACGWNGLPFSSPLLDRFAVTSTPTEIEATILTSSRDIGVRLCAAASVDLSLRGQRVLWVNDAPGGDIPVFIALKRLGIPVERTASTEEALRKLGKESFQVVVTDFRRKDDPRGGYTLLEAISERGGNVPVVIYSNDARPELIKDAKSRGAYDETDDPQRLLEIVISAMRSPSRNGVR